MANKKTDTSTSSPQTPVPTTSVPPPSAGDGGQALMVAPRDAYLEAFVAAKDTALTTLTAIAAKYSGDEQVQIQSLIRSVNPVKEGLEETAKGFQIPTAFILQAVSKQRPEGCQLGDLYTNSGSKIDKPYRFVPLYGFEQNRMFPQGGVLGRPICTAYDGKLGNRFGECAKCPHLPLGKNTTGQKTECDNVLVFVVLGQNLRLMRLEFAKSNRKAGSRVSQLASESDNIWDRWLTLDTAVQRSDKGPDYYTFAVSSANQPTSSHIREAAAALYQMIRSERKAFLQQHWQNTVQRGTQAGISEENVDLLGMGISSGPGGDNPDVTQGL